MPKFKRPFGAAKFFVLDKASTEQYFGVVLSAFSLAQIIACPLVGYWSNRHEGLRIPLVFCHTLSAIGNCMYFCAQAAETGAKRRLIVLISRLTLGFGSGAIGLFQSYAVMASTIEDRPRAIALITGGGALGLTTGPALQLLFTPLSYPGIPITSGLLFNMYTTPALFGLLASLLGILVLNCVFQERYAGILEKSGKLEKQDEDLPPYDKTAVLICCVTKFTQMFTFTNVETIGSPLAMTMFGFNKHQAVTVVAIAHTFLSATAFSVNATVACTRVGKFKIREMKALMILSLVIGLALALNPSHPKPNAAKKNVAVDDHRRTVAPCPNAQAYNDCNPPFGRHVIPCDETCTNGGDVATCCRAHGFGDGDCDGADHAQCWS
ncbi:unnamed protein product [Bursaphelenchus xylophilus]|uniref:(pine wood nematode) hypothetical protein n=1 Tax=Bursaphelenchus xylophilus TaxID=6326 RepID=A0A1I7S6D5_BURXY|nr:unnamed protein product [Bursaphelenchus xylophilus]CAG9128107.1 unnamed protein product [Bursaphelenchus xylophilus]